MSYARFGGDSDVYVYEHYLGFIECCGCAITDPDTGEDFGFFHANTANEMIKHLDKHRELGHTVPDRCYKRIFEEYENLDGQILPFEDQKRLGKITE